MTREADVRALAQTIDQRYGSLDVLVNNVGDFVIAKRFEESSGSILVEGHSDTDDTLKLTSERANAVAGLLAQLGLPAARLTAIGRGGVKVDADMAA